MKFELNGKKHKIIDSWSDVKFSHMKEIMKLDKDSLTDIEKSAKIVSILSGIPYDELIQFESSLVTRLMGILTFLEEVPETDVSSSFTFKGETYFCTTFNKSIMKEWVIFQQIEDMFTENPEDGMTLKIALMYRKKGETVDDVDKNEGALLKERASLFEDLPAETVLNINSFFLTNLRIYIVATNLYSKAVETQQEKLHTLTEIITQSGGGKGLLSKWRIAFLKKTLSLTLKLFKFWNGWNIKLTTTGTQKD
jgi:hypothetical protein